MSSLLQKLENNEAVLLMYLAGELPDADRIEVEQMLAADPALRMALGELTSLHDHLSASMAQAEVEAQPSRRDAAVRQVCRAISLLQQERDRIAPAASAPPPPRRRMGYWAYPLAAAAVIAIGMMIYPRNPQNTSLTQSNPAPPEAAMNYEPVEIIPVASTDDRLSQIQHQLLSLRSAENDLDLFGGAQSDSDR